MYVPVSWSVPTTPATISAWRIYVSESPEAKGQVLAQVDAADRSATIEVGEGVYYVRVLGLYRDGAEPDWQSVEAARLDVSGQESTPEAPEGAAVAAVDPVSARAIADPPGGLSGDGTRLQVLELPDGETDPGLGVVVAEAHEVPGGALPPRGARHAGPLLALEGSGELMPASRRLALRRVTPYGAASPAVVVDVPVVDRPNHYTIPVASVNGATVVGFASPASTDPWEVDATDGVRLLHLPVVDDWDTEFGYPDDWGGDSPDTADGVLRENRYFAAYADFARLQLSATKDLGGVVDFVLEAWFGCRRKTARGCVEDEVVNDWDFPVDPLAAVGDLVDRPAPERATGPVGFFRDHMVDGTPMPLTQDAARLLYVVGDTAPLSTDPADRVPYVPGAILRGRYIDIYVELREPTGMHQLTMPRCTVSARVLMRRTVSDGAPGHVAPPGSLHVDESGQRLYAKLAGVGTSGHVEMARRDYVDAVVQGMDWKGSVRVATTGPLAANTRTGNVLTADAPGVLSIDGVPVSVGNRVLVKDEATGANNGIYVVTVAGSGSVAWALTRADDADSSSDVTGGLAVAVVAGGTNGDTIWVLTTNDPIVLNTTALTFAQVGGGSGPPAAHAASHEDGGSDELDVTGLSGELADPQTPKIGTLVTETTLDRVLDHVPFHDHSAVGVRKVPLRTLGVGVIAQTASKVDVGPSDSSEVTVYTYSVPADSIGAAGMLRLAIRGHLLNNTGGNRALTLRVKLGGTTLIDVTTGNIATGSARRVVRVDLEVQGDGASSAQLVSGALIISGAGSVTTAVAAGAPDLNASRYFEGSGAKDMTSAQTLEVSIQLSASDAAYEADIERALLELL